jgi:hypothetical protein
MDLKQLLADPRVKAVCIGNCPAGDELGLASRRTCNRTVAHAHWYPSSKYTGWICLDKHGDLNKTTIAHELAHLIVGHRIHNERWRKSVRQLGGRVEHHYQRKHA